MKLAADPLELSSPPRVGFAPAVRLGVRYVTCDCGEHLNRVDVLTRRVTEVLRLPPVWWQEGDQA